MEKLTELKNWIRKEERVVVAFSGGVDSTLLAHVAHDVLGDNMIAITGDSHSVPARDRRCIVDFCKRYGILHQFIKTDEFNLDDYKKNPENRCYYCKRELFTKLTEFATANNYRSVLDGTNISDLSGHRPGYRAINEIGRVKTPYIELKITKREIREMAEALGLDVSSKPASACLASRVPFGTEIRSEDLIMVDRAENILRDLGFTQVRVRHHGNLARIQLEVDELARAMKLRNRIDSFLKELGYKFVTLDLKCYGE